MAKASPEGGWGGFVAVGLGFGDGALVAVGPGVVALVVGGGVGWVGWVGSASGELALERVDGRRLGAVGGDPHDAELPDDEEQQDGPRGDGQLADDADDRPKCSHGPLSAAGDAVEVDASGEGGELAGLAGRHVVAEADGVDPFAVDADLGIAVEGGLEPVGVADRLDDVGR